MNPSRRITHVLICVCYFLTGAGCESPDDAMMREVHATAAQANEEVGAAFSEEDSAQTLIELRRLLREGKDSTKVRALRALIFAGDRALPATPEMVALLSSTYATLPQEAFQALRAFETRAPDVTDELRELSQHEFSMARSFAVQLLGYQKVPAAVSALREAMKASDSEQRLWAVRSLRMLAMNPGLRPDAVSALESASQDKDERVRGEATAALERIKSGIDSTESREK